MSLIFLYLLESFERGAEFLLLSFVGFALRAYLSQLIGGQSGCRASAIR